MKTQSTHIWNNMFTYAQSRAEQSTEKRINETQIEKYPSSRTHTFSVVRSLALNNDERVFFLFFQLTEDRVGTKKGKRKRWLHFFFFRFLLHACVALRTLLLFRNKYLIYSIFNLFKLSWKHSHFPHFFFRSMHIQTYSYITYRYVVACDNHEFVYSIWWNKWILRKCQIPDANIYFVRRMLWSVSTYLHATYTNVVQ